MTPASGAISASDINITLQQSSTAQISFNDAGFRGVAFDPSGAVALGDCYSKDMVRFTASSNGGFPDTIGAYGGFFGTWIPSFAASVVNGAPVDQVVRGIPPTYATYRMETILDGSKPQNFFVKFSVNGSIATSASATYGSVGGGEFVWYWEGVDCGLTVGNTYNAYYAF